MQLNLLTCFGMLAALGCGGVVADSADGGVPPKDAASEFVSIDSGSVDEGGYTACRSPTGYEICGGGCAPPVCLNGCDAAAEPHICWNKKLLTYTGDVGCVTCNDGDLCMPTSFQAPLKGLQCLPFELGFLLHRASTDASAAMPIFYYDRSDFTGEAVPNPTTCPSIPGVKICGGNCGGCDVGDHCIGRSPLHPIGFCASVTVFTMCGGSFGTCKNGLSCFTFKVPSDAQPIANANSLCLPAVTCQSLAANLPGGGTCTP